MTVEDRFPRHRVRGIGNHWTRQHYDGDFYLLDPPENAPALSLVFVQSREGNTAADNPDELGGGATDKHLIYEGLSRVAADAVLAGAATVSGSVFFSVWHPELVALRRELGLSRHPAQVVLSKDGRLDMDAWLFNVPDVPVIVLAGDICRATCAEGFSKRPWIEIVHLEPDALAHAFVRLRREFGIRRISAVGGRTTASALIDAGLAQDLCITTTARSAGEPDTSFYTGERLPPLDLIIRKRGTDPGAPISVEHLQLGRPR